MSTITGMNPPETSRLMITVGIATRGRPRILMNTIADLAQQQRTPDEIIVCYSEAEDVAEARARYPGVRFIQCEAGSSRQRNFIIQAAASCDVLVFLDDDFYLEPGYLRITEDLFLNHPSISVSTGKILADGINGPGISFAEAKSIIEKSVEKRHPAGFRTAFNAYGCNMSFRMNTIRQHNVRFDEALPLYGWFEDVDFCRQLAPHGRIVEISNALGVHLGAKSGRTSGLRLGYSQVANPIYLANKGTFTWPRAVQSIFTRCMKNLTRSISPEPYVDRRGRLRGNVLAFRHLFFGSLDPRRITEL